MKYGVRRLNTWIKAGMSTQDWWLLTTRYEVSWRRSPAPRTSQTVGVQVAKIHLSISAQVSAIHITPLEQRSFRRWPGSTSLSSAISIIGPIRISVLRSSRRLLVRPVNSSRMVGLSWVWVDAAHHTHPRRAAQAAGVANETAPC